MSNELSPERLEALVISSLRSISDIGIASKHGIDENSFNTPELREAWRRLEAAAAAGRALPTPIDLAELGVEIIPNIQDTVRYVEELARRSLVNRANSVMYNLVPRIESDPENTIRQIVGELQDLLTVSDLHVGMTDRDAHSRFLEIEELNKRVNRGEAIGIPTGLEIFDSSLETFRPGELVTVFAYQHVGKSFMLVYFCCNAYLAGKRILFLSPESTKQDIELRADVFLSRLDDPKWDFSLTALRTGQADLNKYKEWCERFASREDWITIDTGEHGPFSADDVVALAREYRPDVLAIDGVHLLVGANKSWEVLLAAEQNIKGLSQSLGMVTLQAAQARRDSGIFADEPPEPHEIAYGHAISESSSRMISLGRVPGNPQQRSFKVPKFRDGRTMDNRQYLEFDVDRGLIRQVKRS